MKSITQTPMSSVKSSLTSDGGYPSETRDSFYFPGCRKDANCTCEICIASINATLDLKPRSACRSSITQFCSSRPLVSKTPISFNPSPEDLVTPKSRVRTRFSPVYSPLGSIKRIDLNEKGKRKRRIEEYLGIRVLMMRIFWGLILVFSLEYGVPWMVSRFLDVRFSPNFVMSLGEKSRDFDSLDKRFLFLKNELEGIVGNEVSSCSSENSLWKINEESMMVNSRCILYKSMTEVVSIWGWPLQAAGMLQAGYSPRSLSLISGSIAEWSNEEAKFRIRNDKNSSWTQEKWTKSVVQLEPNTWILEYKRLFLIDNAKLGSAAVELLQWWLDKVIEKISKWEFWFLFEHGTHKFDYSYRSGSNSHVPT